MSLEKFEELWNEQSLMIVKPRIGEATIKKIMYAKANDVAKQIISTLNMEILVMLVCLGGFLGISALLQSNQLYILSGGLAVIFLVFMLPMLRQIYFLKRQDWKANSIKESLSITIEQLNRFLNRYKRKSIVYSILAIPFGGFLGYYFASNKMNMDQLLVVDSFWVYVITGVIVCLLIMNFILSKRFIDALYLPHLKELEELLNEVEQD